MFFLWQTGFKLVFYLNRGVKLSITVTVIDIFIIVMYQIKTWKRSLLVMNSDRLITWSCGSSRLHRAVKVSVSSLFICLTAASLFWLTLTALSLPAQHHTDDQHRRQLTESEAFRSLRNKYFPQELVEPKKKRAERVNVRFKFVRWAQKRLKMNDDVRCNRPVYHLILHGDDVCCLLVYKKIS